MQQWQLATHDPYYYNFKANDLLKNEIAQFINCSSQQISTQFNVAQSFSHILQGLQWQKGDEVILIEGDYPSVTLPFQTNKDITIRWIKPVNDMVCIADIQAVLSSKTRLIALSYVSYRSGQVQPIKAISDFCKKHNILVCVDATGALGVIPIDWQLVNIDFLTASLYKWCFCPQGICLTIFSNSLLNQLSLITAGVFSLTNRQLIEKSTDFASCGQQFESGNLNILGIMLAYETFRWFNQLSINYIHLLLSNLAQQIIDLLLDKNYQLLIDYSQGPRSAIVSFIHPQAQSFITTLNNQSGAATWRDGYIRLSPGIYQDTKTIDKLAQLL